MTPELWRKVCHIFDQASDHEISNFEVLRELFPGEETEALSEVWKLIEAERESMITGKLLVTKGFLKRKIDNVPEFVNGDSIGDFGILEKIGTGSFSKVYLARQKGLNRDIALKISPKRGQEAFNMARMEHESIVRVYSQEEIESSSLHLICMQYIPGLSLEELFDAFCEVSHEGTRGREIIDILDSEVQSKQLVDPSGLKTRQFLESQSFYRAYLWLGIRLADALDYAHSKGVYHLDFKPANIIVNRLGHPTIIDFNVSFDKGLAIEDQILGGTLHYTSPEQKKALLDRDIEKFKTIDHRSDIYSLGLVLKEFLQYVKADTFHSGPINGIIEKCCKEDPNERFQSAQKVRDALKNCINIDRMEQDRATSKLTRFIDLMPLFIILAIILIPQVIASAFNIAYRSINVLRVIGNADQIAVWKESVFWYNIIVYPIATVWLWKMLQPIFSNLKRSRQSLDAQSILKIRSYLLGLIGKMIGLAALGWLPACVFFPTVIDILCGGVSADIYLHFTVSSITCFLVSVAYSILVFKYVLIQFLYPRFWHYSESDISIRMNQELFPLKKRLIWFQSIACLVPLVGAGFISMDLDPSDSALQFNYNKYLLFGLITLSTFGFLVSIRIGQLVREVISKYCEKD